MTIDYTTFDADNHYYEATDAFTATSTRAWPGARCSGPRSTGADVCWWPGRSTASSPIRRSTRWPSRAASTSTSAAATRAARTSPRCSATSSRSAPSTVTGRPPGRHGRPGDRRLLHVPTLGVGMEEALGDDPEAAVAAFHAFNRWLEDDWGYAYRDRIFGAPMIPWSTSTPLWPSSNWCWTGAPGSSASRVGRPSPGTGGSPPATPASILLGRVDEAGVTVGIHSGTPGTTATSTTGNRWGRSAPSPTRRCASC